MRIGQLEVLGNELDVDKTAGHLLDVPDIRGSLLRLDPGAHARDLRRELRCIAR